MGGHRPTSGWESCRQCTWHRTDHDWPCFLARTQDIPLSGLVTHCATQLRGSFDNVPHLDLNSISIPLKGGKRGSGCAGCFWARFLRATTQALGPCRHKACSITTIWKCHSSPPFRGLPDSRCTKPCSRGATPGEVERLGHCRNTDLRARSVLLNEHDANNTPHSQAGGGPVHDYVPPHAIGWLLITPLGPC